MALLIEGRPIGHVQSVHDTDPGFGRGTAHPARGSAAGRGARELHRDLGTRLARTGIARRPDTAIAAQALVLAAASGTRLEFVTADASQARLVRSLAQTHDLDVRVVALAA